MRDVLKLEVIYVRGAGKGAVSNANLDARGRGVAVVDGGILSDIDARGTGVGYSGVGDGKAGWGGEGWAAG
jgi:hypothetical protein